MERVNGNQNFIYAAVAELFRHCVDFLFRKKSVRDKLSPQNSAFPRGGMDFANRFREQKRLATEGHNRRDFKARRKPPHCGNSRVRIHAAAVFRRCAPRAMPATPAARFCDYKFNPIQVDTAHFSLRHHTSRILKSLIRYCSYSFEALRFLRKRYVLLTFAIRRESKLTFSNAAGISLSQREKSCKGLHIFARVSIMGEKG